MAEIAGRCPVAGCGGRLRSNVQMVLGEGAHEQVRENASSLLERGAIGEGALAGSQGRTRRFSGEAFYNRVYLISLAA